MASTATRLPVESLGDPAAPAVLLVAGTSSSMDFWPADFCELLVRAGLRVVRFDQRDTGEAPSDPAGRPSYGLDDLASDALGVLDDLGIGRAHWVGFSQGGWLAQLAGIRAPERVASLTLVSTRPTGHGPNDPDLPELLDRLLAAWEELGETPDPADADAWVEYLVAGERPLASERAPFDEEEARRHARRVVGRTRDLPALVTNHPIARPAPPWRAQLGGIRVPTTVVHGDDDPLFPLPNALALAREIPGADLVVLPDVGHELPARARDRVALAVLATVQRCRQPIGLAATEVVGVDHVATIPGTQVRPSPVHGRGVFAQRAFEAGVQIGVLDGQEVDPAAYPGVVEGLEWNALSADRLLVRAVRTSYGLMNHSANPNVEVASSGRSLQTRREVRPDEELTVDYFAQPVPAAYLAGAEAARLRSGSRRAPRPGDGSSPPLPSAV